MLPGVSGNLLSIVAPLGGLGDIAFSPASRVSISELLGAVEVLHAEGGGGAGASRRRWLRLGEEKFSSYYPPAALSVQQIEGACHASVSVDVPKEKECLSEIAVKPHLGDGPIAH